MIKALTLILTFILLPAWASAETIVYSSNKVKYEGYAKLKSKNAPTVFIIHDWDGLTDYEIKRADMLYDLGFSVFAMDLFGQGVRPTEDKDKSQHTGELYKDRAKMRRLMQAAVKEAQRRGLNTNKIVVMGYCFGGAAALEFARSGQKTEAIVSFHGGLKTPEGQNYKKTKSKIFIHHGTADSHISMQEFAILANELQQNKIEHEMITYGNAPHAFTVFDSPAYRKDSDQSSWLHFTSYLKTIQ